eukprot:m.297651 g.297651  ORF g.297651 m.297651 type:complete len:302 (-) comp13667_c0_seq1:146-1051(-)
MAFTTAVMTASSNTGAACVAELLGPRRGACRVRAIFRTEDKAASLRAHEAAAGADLEVVVGADADEPQSLAAAFQGAQVAVIVTPHSVAAGMDRDGAKTCAMIDAAVAAGVEHIVLIASWTVHAQAELGILAARFAPAEARLTEVAAGNPSTSFSVLRCGYFNQNTILAMGRGIREKSEVVYPRAHLPLVSTDDIGRCAAAIAAARGHGHSGKFYEISGPRRLTNEDLASAFSEVLARPVSARVVPADEFGAKMPPFLRELVVYLEKHGEDAIPLSNDVKTLTGRCTSFEEWLRENKHHFE